MPPSRFVELLHPMHSAAALAGGDGHVELVRFVARRVLVMVVLVMWCCATGMA
jgi:hypothetical protein